MTANLSMELTDTLFRDPQGGSWGSDGNILYTFEPKEGLSTIPFNGGTRKPITESKGALGHHFPHPLPGDKGLLFTIMQSEAWSHTGIAVLSFETGLWRTILEEGTHPHYLSSGYVVYALAGTLQAVPFDLDRLEISGKPIQLLDGVATRFGADFSLSADSTLAYVPGDWGWPDRSLVWVDRDGKTVDNTCDPKNYWWPRISPDGQRVAVTINTRRKGSTDIWICELARNNTLTRITTDPSWDYVPVWTPDGNRATYSATRQSTPDLIEIAADGTGTAEWLLRKKPGIWPASWSPDGSILLFTEEHHNTNFDIWKFPKDGGVAEPWLQTFASEGEPRFSPRWSLGRVSVRRIRSTRGVRGFLPQHRTEISDFDKWRNRACLGDRRRGAILSERRRNDGSSGNDIASVLLG